MLKKVFQYLKEHKEMGLGLVFDSNPEKGLNLEMRGFVDASYADNYGTPKDNRRSTTGFVFMLGGAAIEETGRGGLFENRIRIHCCIHRYSRSDLFEEDVGRTG
jgi:hypothetical protein